MMKEPKKETGIASGYCPRKDRKGASLSQVLVRLTAPPIGEILARVDAFLTKRKIAAYLVGGLVRDALLGRETADIDIAVADDALKVATKVARALGGKYVLLDVQNRVGRVVLNRWVLDFSSFSDHIEKDLARRDFTINAMAVDLRLLINEPANVKLVDPFKGRNDIGKGLVRLVSDGIFAVDPVRLLRAVRHAAELGFSIESTTESLIKRDASLIAKVAGERIREEFLRVLAVPDGDKSLSRLDKLGLLTGLFPELDPAKGIEQPKEHHWDVFEHSLKTAAAVDFLVRGGAWEYKCKPVLSSVPHKAEVSEHFAGEVSHGSTRGSLLKLAALLHDIAKPQTKAINGNGRIRFLGHTAEGAAAAAAALTRLRFSSREIKLVETEIINHMRPTQMSHAGMPTSRAVYRFFRDTGDAGIDILFLSLADHLAARGPDVNIRHWRGHTSVVEYVLDQRMEQQTVKLVPGLVNGNDIIEQFGFAPGPQIGEILEWVKEAQAAGEITTRQQALALIKTKMRKSKQNLKKRSQDRQRII